MAHKIYQFSGERFLRRFSWLIALSWIFPAIVGFAFIYYLELLPSDYIATILTTPLEPAFIVSTLLLALFYFRRYIRPLVHSLTSDSEVPPEVVIKRLRLFPLNFWSAFVTYLLLAPSSVILSAMLYTDFQPQPIDWFRIHLVALIVSIIVGLPIFFRLFDLLGIYFGGLSLERPIVKLRTKVFMIGALIPLLIDTMIVQYYWTRTGYFTLETFYVWLVLEILAIAGSLLFMKSIGQSLQPLEGLLRQAPHTGTDINYLPEPQSTDDLGILTHRYNKLIQSLNTQNRMLMINNRLLRHIDDTNEINAALSQLFDIAFSVTLDSSAWIFLDDPARQQLVCIAQHNADYKSDGIFSMPYPEALPLDSVIKQNRKLLIENLPQAIIYQNEDVERLRLKRVIALPLKTQGEVVGIFMTGHSSTETPYLAGTIPLLQSICHEIAIAIHAQRLREHSLAVQEKSEELNSNIRKLINSTSEGIIAVDNEMHCTFVNSAAEKMTGWSSQELMGQDIHNMLQHSHEDKTPFHKKYSFIYRAIKEQQTYQGDNQILWRKNHSSFPIQLSCSPIEDVNSTGAVVVFKDITHERAIARKVDYLASHDTLTGLINRHEFETRLQQAIYNIQIEKSEHVVCYIDLDQFKVVNDTCGHIAGDELLRQLGNLLQDKIRQGDTLSRLGGDEFGILFLHCELEHAMRNITAIQSLISEYRFTWEQKTFAVGASIGVVTINEHTHDITQALSAADTACYIAKESGRNRIHVYREDDSDVAKRFGEMEWVSRIHDAIDNNGFMLNIQKIVPVASHSQNHHFEVLLTMRDGHNSPIPPGAFIPSAERYNLMTFIDSWVLRNTFEWLSQNQAHFPSLGLCAINLSGQTIGDPNFSAFVTELFEQYQIPPEKICFEITETAAVANMSRASKIIQELKQYGCRFSLDDFGSGMSSFTYLKSLPVDFLKIDGNFVKDIIHDPIDRTMVQSITQIAQVMNLETIAEFVEKIEIIDLLHSIGVDYAQGYAIASPIPIEAFDWQLGIATKNTA